MRHAGAFALLGMLPDADLLFGVHSGPTHGVGAALIAGLVAASVSPANGRLRLGLACAAAYGSHILLDWLGTDTSAPIGIMALWPFATGYYEASLHLFPAVSRRYWQPELFWSQNLRALVTELLILGPVLVAVWISRRRSRGTTRSLVADSR